MTNAAVRTSSTLTLLKAAYALTHQMHAARQRGDEYREKDLRDQRDLVTQEIIRRADA